MEGRGHIVKVKEPLESEYHYLRSGLTLFTYLHLASVPALASALCETKTIAIVTKQWRQMTEIYHFFADERVAGRVATQIGTYLLHKNTRQGLYWERYRNEARHGRRDRGGYVGLNAAEVAAGLRARR